MPKEPGEHNTTPEIRYAMVQMAKQGILPSLIATTFEHSISCVYRVLAHQRVHGHNNDLPRPRRPPKVNARTSRHLTRVMDTDRRQTLAELTNATHSMIDAPVSKKTVSRTLKMLGIGSRIARKKPYLKPAHRKQRMEFVAIVKNWGDEEWTKIIWTDESSVELRKNTCICHIWRHPHEAFKENCLAPTFKSGRTSVMVWGCIAYNRKGPLCFLPKNQRKGEDYMKLILSGPLWDFYCDLFEECGVVKVMEDGAPVHRSASAKKFHDSHSLETIFHPAQSPDMNPLEHVWKLLKEGVNKRPTIPKNVKELQQALLEEWEKIDIV
jgi:transposase